MYTKYIKRIIDFFLAFIALSLLSPLIIVTIIVMSIANKASVFFFQKRPGKNENIFSIIKFKSMNDKKDSNGVLLDNELRLTKVGKFIRKTSIDEIPQLLNVLKGDMSLVGPRPLKVDYLDLYSTQQKRRHEVKPGVTGWAQVNGRNAISHTKKFELDVWYVDNISFLLDLKILYLTVLKVVKKEGVSKKGVQVNKPFDGTN